MAAYTPIRDIPMSGLSEWEYAILQAMKENIEVLMGQRGNSHAVTSDQITATLANPAYQQFLASGAYGGAGPYADGVDYGKLVQTVYNIATDLQNLRATVNTLLTQIQQG